MGGLNRCSPLLIFLLPLEGSLPFQAQHESLDRGDQKEVLGLAVADLIDQLVATVQLNHHDQSLWSDRTDEDCPKWLAKQWHRQSEGEQSCRRERWTRKIAASIAVGLDHSQGRCLRKPLPMHRQRPLAQSTVAGHPPRRPVPVVHGSTLIVERSGALTL